MTATAAGRVAARRPAWPWDRAPRERTASTDRGRASAPREYGSYRDRAGGGGCTPERGRFGERSGSFESELLQGAGAVRPILAHFDPEVEMQAAAEQSIQGQPCRAADTLEALTPRADHYRFLPFAIHPDGGLHAQQAILLG